MRGLTRAAAEVLVAEGLLAPTDVTGFGLLGHGLEMARASGARLVFDAAALPALPGALALAAAGVETGGAAHNRRFTAPALAVGARCAGARRLAHDPQTSGRAAGRRSADALQAVEGAGRGGRHLLARRPRRGRWRAGHLARVR